MTHTEKELIEKLNSTIENNLEKGNFDTDTICRELAISRSHLFRLVKEQTQLSISLYIRQKRMLKAKQLLDDTDLKVSEIAYQIGMDSPQSFTKYFTQEFGINPTEYRKNKSNTPDEPVLQIAEQNSFSDRMALEIAPLSENKAAQKTSKKFIYIGLGGVATCLLIIILYFTQKKTSSLPVETLDNQENAIAVLPFKNLGAPETAFFTEGVMGQIHAALAMIENLKVISKNSSSLFKNSQKTIPQIAHELHVGYILSGTVLQSDKRVKVSIELIKGKEDKTVWTKDYDGDNQDVIVFMNKVAKEIVRELHQNLSQKLAQRLDKQPTTNADAYTLFLQGQKLMQSREKEKLLAGIQKFDEALALDPVFADALAYKASAYFILGNFNFIDMNESIRMAEKNALDAIRLDANNGTAYAVLAGVYKFQYKWEQCLTTYQIALKHNPNDAQINYWYSLALRSVGAFDAAIKYNGKAVSLDPLFPVILGGYINSCSYAGKFDLAKKAIDQGALIFDKEYMYYFSKGTYYLNRKEYREALIAFQKSNTLGGGSTGNQSGMVYCYAKLGQIDSAQSLLKTVTQARDYHIAAASFYAGLEDKESCFKELQLASAQGLMPDYFKFSPMFKFLHTDKRFDDLLQKIGLLNTSFDVQ